MPREGSVTFTLCEGAALALRIDCCAPPYCVAACLALSIAFCCVDVLALEVAVRAGDCSEPPVGLDGVVLVFAGELLGVEDLEGVLLGVLLEVFEVDPLPCPPGADEGAVRAGAESEPPPGPPPDGLDDVLPPPMLVPEVVPDVTAMGVCSD